MLVISPPYSISNFSKLPDKFKIVDHLGGWDSNLYNHYLHLLNQHARNQEKVFDIIYHHILDPAALGQYANLKIKFSPEFQQQKNFLYFKNYNTHPKLCFKNFICSFNGSQHVSRKLLTAALYRFKYFDPATCSKNFTYSTEALDGHVLDYTNGMHQFYRKFFISAKSENFFQTVYSFGHVRYNHAQNIHNLENKLTQSFLHIVSETMATSYCPFVTEKFLYSIVTRGLFLAYAQPGWHAHLEKYYGFKKYSKLFDYRFDSIQNPVERLIELMTIISKFSVLSTDDWRDLYEMESDTIEFNYNHYFSGDYLKALQSYA